MNKRPLLISLCCCFFLSCSTEKEDWAIAENENTIAAYEVFLEQHAQGSNADSANARIEELIWQKTVTNNSVDGYEAYLQRYASGQYADRAEWFLAALNASRDTAPVKLYKKSVIPYGGSKLLTIFNPRINGNQVELSYKLENGMEENPALIATFTEANIAAQTSSFYYSGSSLPPENRYVMSERTIRFSPRPSGGWVRGKTKVRIYLIMANDMDDDDLRAVSNVVTLYIEY